MFNEPKETKLTAVQKMAAGYATAEKELPKVKKAKGEAANPLEEQQASLAAFYKHQKESREKKQQADDLKKVPYPTGIVAVKNGDFPLIDKADLVSYLSHSRSFNASEARQYHEFIHQSEFSHTNWQNCLKNVQEIEAIQAWLSVNPYSTYEQVLELFPEEAVIEQAEEKENTNNDNEISE